MAGSVRSTTWCAGPPCAALLRHGRTRPGAAWAGQGSVVALLCLTGAWHVTHCSPRVLPKIASHALPQLQEIFWTKLQESEAAGQPPEVSWQAAASSRREAVGSSCIARAGAHWRAASLAAGSRFFPLQCACSLRLFKMLGELALSTKKLMIALAECNFYGKSPFTALMMHPGSRRAIATVYAPLRPASARMAAWPPCPCALPHSPPASWCVQAPLASCARRSAMPTSWVRAWPVGRAEQPRLWEQAMPWEREGAGWGAGRCGDQRAAVTCLGRACPCPCPLPPCRLSRAAHV